jgi:hypothetical protein
LKLARPHMMDAREQRLGQARRDRAAAPMLRVAFPTVQQLRLELNFQSERQSGPASQSHVLHPPARAFFEFPCPYTDCSGRFDLGSAVDAALASSTHQAAGRIECSGLRSSNRATNQSCCLPLNYTVTATYRGDR